MHVLHQQSCRCQNVCVLYTSKKHAKLKKELLSVCIHVKHMQLIIYIMLVFHTHAKYKQMVIYNM